MSCMHNVWRARRLYQLNYGTAEFNSRDHKEVEQIFDEAGRCAQTETNLEAGPQSVTQVRPILMYFRVPCSYSKGHQFLDALLFQVVIMMSTGRVSAAQIFSVCPSILSLSWGSARWVGHLTLRQFVSRSWVLGIFIYAIEF